jgi:site-specific DNA-methyltransferase (adenine-specific)
MADLSGQSSAHVRHGEALSVLRDLPDGYVDAVITDPPYSSGGMVRGDRLQDVHTKYVQTDSESGHDLPDFSGDTRDQRGYLMWCSLWLAECLRVAKPGAVCAVFTDWRQLPTTTDALQCGGWVWRGIVPWYKPNGRRTQGRFANNCEYVVWGTAGPRALDAMPNALDGFFQANTTRDRVHIAQKPLEVMREIVKICPRGGLVLDPFAGAGTTGVAAVLENRRFLGIEITEHYAREAQARIDKAAGHFAPEPGTLI